jgi:hypothetical protein
VDVPINLKALNYQTDQQKHKEITLHMQWVTTVVSQLKKLYQDPSQKPFLVIAEDRSRFGLGSLMKWIRHT